MSNEEKFFIYLLENYSEFKNRKTGDVINEWKEKGIINSLKILLSKPELRDAIGVRARKYILDRMVEDVVFSDFKDFIYDNIKC